MMFSLMVAIFGFGCTLFIWGWIGVKKHIFDSKEEFGEMAPWYLFVIDFFCGLLPLFGGVINLLFYLKG